MSRVTAREAAFKLVFEFLFSGEINKRTFGIFSAAENDETESEYIREVYCGVIDNYDELVSIIGRFSENGGDKGFSVERIYKPDLAVLLVAGYEMKYMKSIPNNVSISEAVNLIKRFSTENSHRYVNGVLAAVNKYLAEENS